MPHLQRHYKAGQSAMASGSAPDSSAPEPATCYIEILMSADTAFPKLEGTQEASNRQRRATERFEEVLPSEIYARSSRERGSC